MWSCAAGSVGANAPVARQASRPRRAVDERGLARRRTARAARRSCPGRAACESVERRCRVLRETKWIGISPPTPSSSAATASGSSSRSAFVSRITGRAPLSSASARYRSSRRRSSSWPSAATMRTTSTFAAMTCSRRRSRPRSAAARRRRRRPAWEHGLDGRRCVEPDPVADDREVGPCGLPEHAARDAARMLARAPSGRRRRRDAGPRRDPGSRPRAETARTRRPRRRPSRASRGRALRRIVPTSASVGERARETDVDRRRGELEARHRAAARGVRAGPRGASPRPIWPKTARAANGGNGQDRRAARAPCRAPS